MARILLAEDSPTQVVMLRALLAEDAHDVQVANDGAEALQCLQHDVPDVVITDMQMPVMNGLDLVKRIRADFAQVPVILITAQGSEDLCAEALREGAAAYLPKSQVDDELLSSVQHVLELMKRDSSYKNLIDCLDFYEFQFTLENNPDLIGPLVNLMQQIASGMQLCDDVVRARIGMALEQALLNALYRGNLEISHDEQLKDEEIRVQGEPSLLQRRSEEEPYAARRIYFHARLGKEKVEFTIQDEGAGFDTSQIPQASDPHQFDAENGRGLVLIQSFMDRVEFNERGNQLVMSKGI